MCSIFFFNSFSFFFNYSYHFYYFQYIHFFHLFHFFSFSFIFYILFYFSLKILQKEEEKEEVPGVCSFPMWKLFFAITANLSLLFLLHLFVLVVYSRIDQQCLFCIDICTLSSFRGPELLSFLFIKGGQWERNPRPWLLSICFH